MNLFSHLFVWLPSLPSRFLWVSFWELLVLLTASHPIHIHPLQFCSPSICNFSFIFQLHLTWSYLLPGMFVWGFLKFYFKTSIPFMKWGISFHERKLNLANSVMISWRRFGPFPCTSCHSTVFLLFSLWHRIFFKHFSSSIFSPVFLMDFGHWFQWV